MDLHNRPLLDNRADVALFVEPATLGDPIQAAVRKGLNVALLGGPGTGKTTLLRQLCRHSVGNTIRSCSSAENRCVTHSSY